MTIEKHAQTGEFALRLRSLRDRLTLTDPELAEYLGAPVPTVRKWLAGTRAPGAAVVRLLDVLGAVEALNPAVHDSFLPERKPTPSPARKRGVRNKNQLSHVEKSDSVMSKNPL